MGYANAIPGWLLEEFLGEQKERAKKQSGIRLTARIITGSARYEKELHDGHMRRPIWKICTETMKQLESEKYIVEQLGFTTSRTSS